MIKENKSEFDKLNITYWWSKGFTGKGTNIVVLDVNGVPLEKHNVKEPLSKEGKDKKLGHKTHVCAIIREVLPDANIYAFHWAADYKEEIIEWIRENKNNIDVINCSFEGNVQFDLLEIVSKFDIPIMGAMGNYSKPIGNST